MEGNDYLLSKIDWLIEEIIIDGEKVIDGDILISEFNNRGKQFIAVRFDLDANTSEYYVSNCTIILRQIFCWHIFDSSYYRDIDSL